MDMFLCALLEMVSRLDKLFVQKVKFGCLQLRYDLYSKVYVVA